MLRSIAIMCLLALASAAAAERVTDPRVLADGRATYEKHCAACHGENARGLVEDWRKPGADGRYPAPPLNGTAHAWHHPFSQLKSVVRNGTARLGGSMPAWGGTLSERKIDNTLHYLISLWPREVFQAWEQRGGYR